MEHALASITPIALSDEHLDAVAGGCMGHGHHRGYTGGWPRFGFGDVDINLTFITVENSTVSAGENVIIGIAKK
jgi:hypothetical protein